jgi:hypothetical protein
MEDNPTKKEEYETIVLFSTSLIYNQGIDKLWLFLRDLQNDVKILDKFDNFEFIKGDNTFIPGNKFSINWIGLTLLKFECISIKFDRTKKEIKWKAKGDIGIKFYKTMTLYRITHDSKTLVKVIITKKQKKADLNQTNTDYNYYLNLEYSFLLKKSLYLNGLNEDIISYESCIINKNYSIVWRYISDLKKLNEFAPIIGTNFEYNSPNIKVGVFLKFFIKELNIIVFMKIIEFEEIKKNKSCWIKLETIGSKVDNSPKMIEYKITIIDNKTTYLSIFHQFYNTNSKNYLKKFNINKKEIIKKYKILIEGAKE